MDSREYSLNDGQNKFKLTKLILDKTEWTSFLAKLKNEQINVKTLKDEFKIDQKYINSINARKCVPLIGNDKLFPGKGDYIAVVQGGLGDLYFRLHWALNACIQTSEYSKDVEHSAEKIYSDFVKWWNDIKTSNKLSGYLAISKAYNNKFRINDLSAYLARSINYKIDTPIKTEDEYDSLHIKYVFPWVMATEICLELSSKKVIDLPDSSGFIAIKQSQ